MSLIARFFRRKKPSLPPLQFAQTTIYQVVPNPDMVFEGPNPALVTGAWIFRYGGGLAPIEVELVHDFGDQVAVFRIKGNWAADEPDLVCFAYDYGRHWWIEAQEYTSEVLRLPEEKIVEIEHLTGRKFGRKG